MNEYFTVHRTKTAKSDPKFIGVLNRTEPGMAKRTKKRILANDGKWAIGKHPEEEGAFLIYEAGPLQEMIAGSKLGKRTLKRRYIVRPITQAEYETYVEMKVVRVMPHKWMTSIWKKRLAR